ncbi:MAG: hypothetical protein Q8R44_18740 [Novosphingobium sp.]|nr:hypothetical protein [Novosphingobium sp.]
MKTIVKVALGAAASIALGGCATVINGTSQEVKFQSDPGGAQVKLTGGQSCTTPCEVSLKRRHDLRADFSKTGFKPAYVLIQSKTGGAMAGNLLLGGIIGGAVDAANGASNHLSPSPVNVKLAAEGTAEESMLIGDKDKPLSLAEHNAKVRDDVAETIGVEAAGTVPAEAAVAAATPAEAAPAQATSAEPIATAPVTGTN